MVILTLEPSTENTASKLDSKIVLIDIHEPETIELRLKAAKLMVKRETLESGDYAIGNVLIERKEIGDFFNSLNSGRLFNQLFKMKLSGKRNFLVIIGNYPSRKMKIPKNRMEQQISRLSFVAFISYDVLFTRVETEEQFIEFLKWLYQRCNTETHAPLPKKEEKPEDMKRAMIGCIAGFGPKLADELSDKFTLRELMDIPEKDLIEYVFSGRKLGKRAEAWFKVRKL